MRYRKAIEKNDYTVVQDDREKQPWRIEKPVKVRRLKTGDYSIVGFEDRIAIEKKSGFGEVLQNLSKPSRPRFIRFLERLVDYDVKVLIIEEACTERNVKRAVKEAYLKSGKRCQLTDATLWYWLVRIETYYGVPIIMCDKKCVGEIVGRVLDAAWMRVKGA